jgi:hypothetical protein
MFLIFPFTMMFVGNIDIARYYNNSDKFIFNDGVIPFLNKVIQFGIEHTKIYFSIFILLFMLLFILGLVGSIADKEYHKLSKSQFIEKYCSKCSKECGKECN